MIMIIDPNTTIILVVIECCDCEHELGTFVACLSLLYSLPLVNATVI